VFQELLITSTCINLYLNLSNYKLFSQKDKYIVICQELTIGSTGKHSKALYQGWLATAIFTSNHKSTSKYSAVKNQHYA